jgi:hypothetical protein
MKTPFWGIVSVLFFASCNQENKVEQVERAFYYWKSDRSLDDKLVKEINDLNVRKIYYKLFEIDYSETMGNYPFAKNSPSQYSFD